MGVARIFAWGALGKPYFLIIDAGVGDIFRMKYQNGYRRYFFTYFGNIRYQCGIFDTHKSALTLLAGSFEP